MQKHDYAEISIKFLEIFDRDAILRGYNSYEWGGNSTHRTSHETRDEVARRFSNWVREGCRRDAASEALNGVHKWGFGGKPLSGRQSYILEEPNLSKLTNMLQVWFRGNEKPEMISSLAECLRFPYLGLATISKWICFIDQKSYGIYDSRVSLALRKIQIQNRRVFPTLGSRSKTRPRQDHLSSNPVLAAEMQAGIYYDFNTILHDLLTTYELERVADLEIALFMLGADSAYWGESNL